MFSAGTTDNPLTPSDISPRAHVSLCQRAYTKQVQTISEYVGWLCVQRQHESTFKHSGESAFKRNAEGDFCSQKMGAASLFEIKPPNQRLAINLVKIKISKIFKNLFVTGRADHA
jgi:hypothetical protein